MSESTRFYPKAKKSDISRQSLYHNDCGGLIVQNHWGWACSNHSTCNHGGWLDAAFKRFTDEDFGDRFHTRPVESQEEYRLVWKIDPQTHSSYASLVLAQLVYDDWGMKSMGCTAFEVP